MASSSSYSLIYSSNMQVIMATAAAYISQTQRRPTVAAPEAQMEVAATPETTRGTRMEVGDDGVALVTIFNPPLNCFTFDLFISLKESYEQALARDDVRAIVITGDGGNFSGGFDVSGFNAVKEGKVDLPKPGYFQIDVMTNIFEASKKPAVAAIDGLCVGGGLEIAMTCHGRISTARARIGLPELAVGLIPGLGGTQRLPRLVGLDKALDMLLTSKLVPGEEAYQSGLVDAVTSPDELIKTARSWALDIAESRKPWIKTLSRTDKLEPLDRAKNMLESARAQTQTLAASACIDAIMTGVVSGHLAGIWKETESFAELVFSDGFKNLPNSIFAALQ